MKYLVLTFLLFTTTFFSQDEKYFKAMESALNVLDTAMTMETFIETGNRFERIALAEKTQWLPYYYAAQANAVASFLERNNTKKDEILDKAQKFIDAADEISPDNSEIYVIKGIILQGRIMVDFMNRGMQYSQLANQTLNKAIEFNEENPRPYLILGQSILFTPEAFGGGKDKAKPYIDLAKEKFETFIPESSIHPNWGKKQMEEINERMGL
jgi:hypothetical protein